MTTDAEVVIVGGSVAGAATAIFLARRGRSVVVLDRAHFPREKPCGEGLMPQGVDLLAELGILESVRRTQPAELFGVRYTLESGESVAARFPSLPGHSPVALGVRRLALDRLLLDSVRQYGRARVQEGFHVRDLLQSGGRVTGVTDGERAVTGRVVVGADGLHSLVRTALGWDASRSRPRRYAVVGHVSLHPARPLAPEVEVILYRGMEAYLTPLGGSVALVAVLGGRGIMQRFAGDLEGMFRQIVFGQRRLRDVLAGATLLPGVRATGPFAVRARKVAGRGALLVGDAAGFLDPITGEGMASALLQARAAACAIDRALEYNRPSDLSAYSAEHHRITSTGNLLTWVALGLCTFPSLTPRAMAGLKARPGLFGKLLAVNCGFAGLRSIAPRDWVALIAGG